MTSADVQQKLVETASDALVKVLTAPKKPGPPKPSRVSPTFTPKVLASTSQKFLGSTQGKAAVAHAAMVLIPALLLGVGAAYWLYGRKA